MKIGVSYKQHPIRDDHDVIVIGSGMGGLACAALLARHGSLRVLVLEKHYTAGGFTHVFTRPGYEWDVGVHYIGEVARQGSLLRVLFDHLSDGQLKWADMGEVYDTIVIGADRYDFVKGREAWRARMHAYFPNDTAAIDAYLERVRGAVRKSRNFFAEKALPGVLAALVGPALRAPLLKETRVTTAHVLEGLTPNKRLRAVLAGQYGDYGLPPGESSFYMHAAVVRHYLEGGAYPVGGSARIAETILPQIEAAGGTLRTNAEVAEVMVEHGRAVGVKLQNGDVLRAPVVISDAGVALTFGRLLQRDVVEQHGLMPTVEGAGPSLAHMSLYVGFKQTAAEMGLHKTNLWVYPHDDHDAAVAAFAADPEAPLPVTYISFPSAKDPDFERRHPGRATVEVVVPAPYAWFSRWEDTRWHKRGEGYDAFKARFTERLLDALYAQCPQLRGKVDHAELSTPLSTRHFAGHPHGEIYGLSHTPARFEARWLKPATPVPGLFLTGSDICSAGVGGALVGGALTASVVLGKNLLTAVMES